MNVKIWKVSHGKKDINEEERNWLAKHNFLCVHENTLRGGAENFVNGIQLNDLVSLSYSGELVRLVKVISNVESHSSSPMGAGWLLRRYESIIELDNPKQYQGLDKGWTPIRRNTCAPIPENDLSLFEQAILKPYFNLSLSDPPFEDLDDKAYPWIAKCKSHISFLKFLDKKGVNKFSLNDAIRVVHQTEERFDFYIMNRADRPLIFGKKESGKGSVAGRFALMDGQVHIIFPAKYGREKEITIPLSDDLSFNDSKIVSTLNEQKNFINNNNLIGKGRWPIQYGEEQDESEECMTSKENGDNSKYPVIPLNQILYGPPGTGKTYHTIEAAVKAAEPNFKVNSRKELKAKYDSLVKDKRVRFVTFHQSYGYEEFVEGLSAKTEGDQLSYFEKDGVFKLLCIDANEYQDAKTKTVASSFEDKWQGFSEELAEADDGIKIDTLSKKTYYTVTDITNNTIRFDKSKGSSVHSLSVKTLRAVHNGEKEIKGGLQPYYGAVIEYLKKFRIQSDTSTKERKNFVLIIDEINRGNISKIFGELITLIEPSKRSGRPEAIEVTLPYSSDRFSVPDNLFIVGTMNTADRSLALMDTALRRRFDFIEMMPDYNVLRDERGHSHSIESDAGKIDLALLLQTLNSRISALYDREHQLGHAFLMPVVKAIAADEDEKALIELKSCFQNKIIPLLAEYFFEDWQKIRLVLGDNQKPETYQLIKQSDVDYEVLFGDTEDVGDVADDVLDYKLINADSELWTDPLTYIGIYSAGSLPKDEG